MSDASEWIWWELLWLHSQAVISAAECSDCIQEGDFVRAVLAVKDAEFLWREECAAR